MSQERLVRSLARIEVMKADIENKTEKTEFEIRKIQDRISYLQSSAVQKSQAWIEREISKCERQIEAKTAGLRKWVEAQQAKIEAFQKKVQDKIEEAQQKAADAIKKAQEDAARTMLEAKAAALSGTSPRQKTDDEIKKETDMKEAADATAAIAQEKAAAEASIQESLSSFDEKYDTFVMKYNSDKGVFEEDGGQFIKASEIEKKSKEIATVKVLDKELLNRKNITRYGIRVTEKA